MISSVWEDHHLSKRKKEEGSTWVEQGEGRVERTEFNGLVSLRAAKLPDSRGKTAFITRLPAGR